MQSVDALSLMGFRSIAAGEAEMPVVWSGSWDIRFETGGGIYSAFTNAPGSALTLNRVRGTARLEVMCTAWSGVLEMESEGQTLLVDTYSAQHQCKEFDLPGVGERSVTIRLLEGRNPEAHDRQVWIHRLLLDVRPSWQVRHHRITPALSWVDGDFGTFMVLEHDKPVSSDIKLYGSWGAKQVEQFRALVRPGSVVADVGANLGHHTVVLSKLVGPTGKVLAFEPQKRVHRILQANLVLNGCDNVVPFEYALGREAAKAQMFPQDYDSGEWNVGGLSVATAGGQLQFSEHGLPIEIRRLDDVPDALELDFVKTDAQGFDFSVLQGGRNVLARARPMLVCEVAPAALRAAGADYEAMYRFLDEAGYRVADVDTMDFDAPPRRWSGAAEEEWDVIAVHRERADHLARVRAAVPR